MKLKKDFTGELFLKNLISHSLEQEVVVNDKSEIKSSRIVTLD